jgi:all-trans-retinol dehydrogenase (NAD+)
MERKRKDVRGKVVLVTGGSRGMGRLIAERFAADGARVVLWARTEADLQLAVDDFRKQGWEAHAYAVDVSDPLLVKEAAARVREEVGPVDVLVNNAGIVQGGPFLEVSPEAHRRTMDINFNACMWTIQAFLPGMLERNQGHIINMASAAGFAYTPRLTSYCASKAALIQFTDALRLEVKGMGRRGVKFTIVCPSFIRTGMFDGVRAPFWLPWLDPEKLADKIYRGYHRNADSVIEPFMARTTPFFRAVTRRKTLDFFMTLLGLSRSMQGWTGHT